jgi:hypothetical protein
MNIRVCLFSGILLLAGLANPVCAEPAKSAQKVPAHELRLRTQKSFESTDLAPEVVHPVRHNRVNSVVTKQITETRAKLNFVPARGIGL